MKTPVSLFTLLFASAFSRGVSPTPTLTLVAATGDGITLPCRLDREANVENYAIDWKRVDLNQMVCGYRYGRPNYDDQADRYRGRTSLDREDLKRGILDLEITSLTQSDSGVYRCYVPKLNASCEVNLTVVPKDEQDGTKRHESSTTPAPVEEETGSADRRGADWKHVAGGVGGVVGVVVFVVLLLVKLEVIQVCKKKKATPPTSTEMENLQAGAPEGDEDPGGAADRQLSHLV